MQAAHENEEQGGQQDHQRRPSEHVQHCNHCGAATIVANPVEAPEPPGAGVGGAALLAVITGMLVAAGLAHLFQVTQRPLSDRLVAMLRDQPGRPIGQLARELYGSDSEADRNRTRALLAQLGRLRKIRNISPGRWEAISADDTNVPAPSECVPT